MQPKDEPPSQSTSELFAGAERERIITEIVEEIRKDGIKSEAGARIKQLSWGERISGFFQHPAVLIIIGFLATGVVGGILANRWQRTESERQEERQTQEWNRQQRRLLTIHNIDLKYQIISDLTKSLGERNGAATAVLEALAQSVHDRQISKEVLKKWDAANTEWRIQSQVLKLRISAHIDSSDALATFQQVLDAEKQIFASVEMLKQTLGRPETDEVTEEINQTNNIVKSSAEQMKHLINIIITETQADANK